MAGYEKVFQDQLPCLATHFLQLIPVGKEISDPQRCSFGSIDQETSLMIVHLESDATHFSTDNRFAFPHRFGHCQTEPFPSGFLQDNVRNSLEPVDRAARRKWR